MLREVDRGQFAIYSKGFLFNGPIKLLNLPWNKLSSMIFSFLYNILEVNNIKSEMHCFCFSGKGLSGKESAVKWWVYAEVMRGLEHHLL